MILWTIQPIEMYEQLKHDGHLYGPAMADLPEMLEKSYGADWENSFGQAYRWMIDQMEQRLPPKPMENRAPMWAWYQWQDAEHKRPDLRARGYLPSGQKGVRIEFEIEDSQVLLSDFQLWHYPLNYWYLPNSLEEDEIFEAALNKHGLSSQDKPLPVAYYHQQVQASWDKIFDIDWADLKEEITLPRHKKAIQATFWEVKLAYVHTVKEFIGR